MVGLFLVLEEEERKSPRITLQGSVSSLCILMCGSMPRNKPNHISITKKMVLYGSCMHNIIYTACFLGKQQNIFTKLVFMVNERKTWSYYGWDHHNKQFEQFYFDMGIWHRRGWGDSPDHYPDLLDQRHSYLMIKLNWNKNNDLKLRGSKSSHMF